MVESKSYDTLFRFWHAWTCILCDTVPKENSMSDEDRKD